MLFAQAIAVTRPAGGKRQEYSVCSEERQDKPSAGGCRAAPATEASMGHCKGASSPSLTGGREQRHGTNCRDSKRPAGAWWELDGAKGPSPHTFCEGVSGWGLSTVRGNALRLSDRCPAPLGLVQSRSCGVSVARSQDQALSKGVSRWLLHCRLARCARRHGVVVGL